MTIPPPIEKLNESNIMLYQYLAPAPMNELQKSIIYDDYGRTDTLAFDNPTGDSNVLGVAHLTPGDYPIEFDFFERAGGADGQPARDLVPI